LFFFKGRDSLAIYFQHQKIANFSKKITLT